ncbi:hypothetical protein FNV43_RR18256 [Rhamnella rubrinervis]|uniref:Protein cornichon homolog 4 n=1 Tax=Rhamnella rubrinervis TaxID=2594499 RepID=A0A8K0GWB5_9ROSA|nr:hypothetical protein FNV43_RR18256 [Rhamnella rubrinervis]
MWALWTWLFSFFFILALLLIIGFQLVCLIDLEYDYINPYDSASRINMVILPEFITQGVLCAVLLVTGHWLICLMSLPYLYYNVTSNLDETVNLFHGYVIGTGTEFESAIASKIQIYFALLDKSQEQKK